MIADSVAEQATAQKKRLGIEPTKKAPGIKQMSQIEAARELSELQRQKKLQKLLEILIEHQKRALRVAAEDLRQPPNYKNRVKTDIHFSDLIPGSQKKPAKLVALEPGR